MKKQIMQNIKSVIIVLALVIGVSYVSAAWNNPPATPPDSNTDAPINVGSTAQTKSGTFTVAGLGVSSGDFKFLPLSGTAPTAGQVLTADGSDLTHGKVKWEMASIPNGIQVFDTTGSWTVPAGVTRARVSAWGGGGGGGGASDCGGAGFGGGAGGYGQSIVSVTPGESVSVTIGAGGTAGVGGSNKTNGGSGGNTTFKTITANGGSGGSSDCGTTDLATAGGSATATVTISGGTGGLGGYFTDGSAGGYGGSAPMGGSGGAFRKNSDDKGFGDDGDVPGGGGAGGNGHGAGGAGAHGRVVVEY